MNSSSVIKFGLLGLAGYFVIGKVFPNFQWSSIFNFGGGTGGTGSGSGSGSGGSSGGSGGSSGSGGSGGSGSGGNPPPTATFKINGTVSADVNNSLSAMVSINGGAAEKLNVILDSNTWWDALGHEVTADLKTAGVDTSALLAAFQAAYKPAAATDNTAAQIAGFQATVNALSAQLTPGLQASNPGLYASLQAQVNQLNSTISQLKAAAGLHGMADVMARYSRQADGYGAGSRFQSRFN